MSLHFLDRRQGVVSGGDNNSTDDDGFSNDWWWSSTAYAVKIGIVGAIFFFFLAFVIGGHIHAKRRMKRGLPPLAYHRWMLSRRQRTVFYGAHPNLPEAQRFHHQQQFSFYRPGYGDSRAAGSAYPMGAYGQQQQPPPPAYGHEDYVPAYTPPQGPNKVNPDQNYVYQPPQGAPPTGPGQAQMVYGEGSSGPQPQQEHPSGDLGRR